MIGSKKQQQKKCPVIEIDLGLVENYPPIEKILGRLCFEQPQDGETVQEIYFLLNEFITKQEQTLGPKRFKKLIQNIFTIISQYVINMIRSPYDESQQVFFHLTYYKKNCGKYIDNFYSSFILIFYIISNFKMNQLPSVEEKIKECRALVREILRQKDREREKEVNIFLRLCALFEAQIEFKQNNLKKAKDSCSKIISLASLELTEAIKGKRPASAICKIELLLTSLTVSNIYKGLEKHQLYTFILNKCIEYSEDNSQFLKLLQVDQLYPREIKIKLTRLQEKIRRVELIEQQQNKKAMERSKSNTISINLKRSTNHSTHKGANNQIMSMSSSKHWGYSTSTNKLTNITNKILLVKDKSINKKSTTFHHATLRANPTHQIAEPDVKLTLKFPKNIGEKQKKQIQEQKESELKNLLIVKDKKKNYYRLKEQTLKYLKKQNNQLKKVIRIKDKEIKQINQVKQVITNQLDVGSLKQQIQTFEGYEKNLIKEIQANKWEYLEQLPAVNKINRYLKGFFQLKYYWHAKNVYSLVYGEMINISQIKMISVLKRKVSKQSKQAISQVTYNKIKHQVEFIKQTKDINEFTYFMNIYQTQKGDGINQNIQISADQFKVIRYEPFYNFYSMYKGELISFEQHLKSLSPKEAYYVNKFIRLMSRFNPTKGKTYYKKDNFTFNYNFGASSRNAKIPSNTSNTSAEQKLSNPTNNKLSDHTDNKLSEQNDKKLSDPLNQSVTNQSPTKSTTQSPTQMLSFIFLLKIHHIPLSKTNLNKSQQKLPQKSQKSLTNSKNNDKNNSSHSNSNSISVDKSRSQLLQQKMLQITIQKISNFKYSNPIYNFSLLTKLKIPESEFNQKALIQSVLCKKMNEIFSKFHTEIYIIQKHLRRKLSSLKTQKIKPGFQIQTYAIKGILFTLVYNKSTNKNVFFIENLQYSPKTQELVQNIVTRTAGKKLFRNYQIFTKKDVSFTSLDFLSKIEHKLAEDTSFQDKYSRIQKYLKIKHFATKIFFKSKNIRFFTDFQTQFKRKLCFAIIKKEFLFRGKMREGKIMYMLTVKEFSKIPRPYTFRIFTFDKNSDILISAEKTIYNKEKLFLESKLSTINEVVEILSRHQFEIFAKAKAQAIKKVSSRISILSNYSFQSGESNKEHDQKGHVGGMFNRRMSKNSMFAKFRHKALIKNQDLEAIKKLVEQRNMNRANESSSSSPSSRNSVVTTVQSVSSEEEESDGQ